MSLIHGRWHDARMAADHEEFDETRVAILMPSSGQRALANLARDAIASFTGVPHDVLLLDHTPYPGCSSDAAHLRALETLRMALCGHSHVFLMHDDALPLRKGWLSLLLSKPGPAAAIVSHRSGRGQSAGTLFPMDIFRKMDLRPNLPAYDVAESVPAGWRASMVAWRGPESSSVWKLPAWMRDFDCDIAVDKHGGAFYAHLGGGTIGTPGGWGGSSAHDQRIAAWIAAARTGLGL